MTNIKSYWKNYINGAFVDGSAGRIAVENPASLEVLAEHALADEADIATAVLAAKTMHESRKWSGLRPVIRGRKIQEMGRYIHLNLERYANLLTLEQGKPLWEARIEIEGAARYFEYYGNQAETIEGQSIPLGDEYWDFTSYEPYGVTAHIIPWNYPVEMAARSISAALVTGNACVVKTPELAPLSAEIFAEAAEAAALPAGALNILCGYGNLAGNALTSHHDVRQIVFTGSVATGIKVAENAARIVAPCVLELGGKSAAIVHDDADLQAFENDIRWGIYFNAGQVCSAMSRVIVHESRHDELVERAVKIAKSIHVGAGIDRPEFGANMGAMISLDQRDQALAMVERAQTSGANIAAGGHQPNIHGAFMEPTVLTNVQSDMEIARQEAFAPILSVMSFSDDDEAIKIANDTDYGLVAGVFTRDLDRATHAAGQLRAGQVFVNEWFAGGVETPFGGYGKSGYGREKGRAALWNYVQTKNIAIKRNH